MHRGVWRVRVRHVRLYLRVILTNRALARHGQLSTLSPVLPTEAANLAASYDAAQCPLLALADIKTRLLHVRFWG